MEQISGNSYKIVGSNENLFTMDTMVGNMILLLVIVKVQTSTVISSALRHIQQPSELTTESAITGGLEIFGQIFGQL